MHHHDCPCPPVHHCHSDVVAPHHHHDHTDDVAPHHHHGHTDDVAPHHHHCHTDDDVAPPMFFGPTKMFPWPTSTTTTTSSSSRSYGHNARRDVRVDVPPPSTTDVKCEDTPRGKCALGILGLLFWGAMIALIIYAVKK